MTTIKNPHSFHIPVMGLAYTIDTPIKVAQFGIDSVISIVDDELIEKMHAFYSEKFELPYKEISKKVLDYRAERITAYLNTVDKIVKQSYGSFCAELANSQKALNNFIEMLPKVSHLRKGLQFYASSPFDKTNEIRSFLSKHFRPGAIDVNIMTKVDKANYNNDDVLPSCYNDAHASLRGFAHSRLESSVVLSAGMNPSLYNYLAEFPDFFPDESGKLKKKVILKVSDFRSALIQSKFLAKKGIWVSEYRIESGLNCGGHAFATNGLLLGPILEEFKQQREELINSAYELWVKELEQKQAFIPKEPLEVKITVQGGVGTAAEHQFLLEYYKTDSVGWGSPFLLVPEATTTDAATRKLLIGATEQDFYKSNISPLGVPFNTVKGTTNDGIKSSRIEQNKAGSSCPKKLLALHNEYDGKGICTASRKYQKRKLFELEQCKHEISEADYKEKHDTIVVKSCLCVGLANSAYMENDIQIKGEEQGVVICPGPNMAYFDKEVSLYDMVRHIYGYSSVLQHAKRPNIFIKELELYINYLKEQLIFEGGRTAVQLKKWSVFKDNLLTGVNYYEKLFNNNDFFEGKEEILISLQYYKVQLENIILN
ncbi:hypothetical protein [Flavobacterium beibuense]|uniref:Uncharacterized protein n=1 Tax=Flavobacterium beibuense TaxID=657326 RepID=A0A444WEB8_9FLAO|nr:hypothetical protein [Flavobacterium beibuense]RYJ44201.1 hypothetical protein NU09_0811 [Flavobacterium beibuense]